MVIPRHCARLLTRGPLRSCWELGSCMPFGICQTAIRMRVETATEERLQLHTGNYCEDDCQKSRSPHCLHGISEPLRMSKWESSDPQLLDRNLNKMAILILMVSSIVWLVAHWGFRPPSPVTDTQTEWQFGEDVTLDRTSCRVRVVSAKKRCGRHCAGLPMNNHPSWRLESVLIMSKCWLEFR